MNRKNLMLVLLLLFVTPIYALDACFTGSWFDPARAGEGINIEVLDAQTAGYFYTYGFDGREWWTFQGTGEVMPMFQTRVLSFDPLVTETTVAGEVALTAIDNNTLRFSFIRRIENGTFCLNTFCQGDHIYTRLTQIVACGD